MGNRCCPGCTNRNHTQASQTKQKKPTKAAAMSVQQSRGESSKVKSVEKAVLSVMHTIVCTHTCRQRKGHLLPAIVIVCYCHCSAIHATVTALWTAAGGKGSCTASAASEDSPLTQTRDSQAHVSKEKELDANLGTAFAATEARQRSSKATFATAAACHQVYTCALATAYVQLSPLPLQRSAAATWGRLHQAAAP